MQPGAMWNDYLGGNGMQWIFGSVQSHCMICMANIVNTVAVLKN